MTAPGHRLPAAPLLLALAALSAISLAGPADARAQGKKGGDWQEPDAGSVPNRFGALIHVAGKAGEYALMFQNEQGEIRIVEMSGSKVPQQAFLLRRAEPDSKAKPEPGQKWRDAEAGVIPASFGAVVSFTGTKNNYGLVFKNDEGELRLIDFQGTQVKKLAKRIDRKEAVSAKEGDGPGGWKEEAVGRIPAEFGPLVAVMGTSPQLSFVFQDESGQIRIIDLSGSRVPQKATKISREY
jgi:hypothetical protein